MLTSPDGLHADGKRIASLVKAIKEERGHGITKDEELSIIEGEGVNSANDSKYFPSSRLGILSG